MVEWKDNWVSFLDNMLQTKILLEDTRNLYVPTGIDKMRINAVDHIKFVKKFGEEPLLPVHVMKKANQIK